MTKLPTISVHVCVRDDAGNTVPDAKVRLRLDRYEVDDGYVVPSSVESQTNDEGEAVLSVWPNGRGSRSSNYYVSVTKNYTTLVDGTAVFPADAGDIDLWDYLQSPPFPARDGYAEALKNAAESAASSAADAATNKAGESAALAKKSASAAADSVEAADQAASAASRSAEKATQAATRADEKTAGLANWESDGRVVTTPLPIKSPSIARSDLPTDVPDGARVYVPDCSQPATSIIDGRGAECIHVAGRWVRLGDYGDIYTPLDRIIGNSGMYTRVRQSVLYRDVNREHPVIDAPQTAALIADESPAHLDLVQPVMSRQSEWDGTQLTVDGLDDGYVTNRKVESSDQKPLFVALGLRLISGANNYDIINYIPSSGISARVGTRFNRRIYYIFDNLETGSSTGAYFTNIDLNYTGIFAIAIEIANSGIFIIASDGSRVPIDYRGFEMPSHWSSSAVVSIFGGQPNADIVGAAVCTNSLDQAQRAAIIRYVTGNMA